jgi:NADH-quinone oxidoreductase subunit G
MSDITVEINGIKCQAKEGEYLLNIARREDIFIPAICYQTQCSPSLACRLCIVEADDKRVYACNAKAKDGMVVKTNSDEIAVERKTIMQVYDVNHPLQCGVCDQSGDCELQNYTLYMDVEKQDYAIADTFRPIRDWGLMKYDAGLCIVCEKCVTVCKDMIGDAVLKTVPRGGDALPKELKETMPKDSYAMWNKLQKSIIGTVNEDNSLECQDCGECIAVCPVGALVSTDFQYTANSWELTKIPVANPHSSDCSLLYYETKHGDAKNYETKIFRVTNDAHYVSLSGAARFGYDFENRVAGKDRALFEKAVDFIQNEADTIRFTSYITNEEALILQKIKEKYNLKLINDDALRYQKFMKAYASTSGETLYNGTMKSIKASNFIVCVGTAVRYDAPSVGFAINNAVTMNKGAGLYFHPVGDSVVETFAKNMMAIQNHVGAEEHVLAYILKTFSDIAQEAEESSVEKLPKEIADIVAKYDESIIGLPEGFDATLTKMLAKKDTFSLVLGEDLYCHDSAENIAKMAGLISRYTNFTVTIIPSKTNTLGVSLICDLDEEAGSKVLAYNATGDFVLSALGDGDLDMPALNQQEGTYTSIEKKVVPTNAALSYAGYVLNDLANALGFEAALTVDYTPQLPTDKGYMMADFDALPNLYDNAGNEVRGYDLTSKDVEIDGKLEKLASVKAVKGDIIYLSNPINQFNAFTNKAHQLKSEGALYVSAEFLEAKGLSEGESVSVKTDGGEVEVKVELDKQLMGEIAYLPTFDTKLNSEVLFKDGYRFTTATIGKV